MPLGFRQPASQRSGQLAQPLATIGQPYRRPYCCCCCYCCWQVGNLKVTYSVHTQAGADLGGNVKENQVRPPGRRMTHLRTLP